MAHQYLYVPCDAPSPDLMIIDESVVNTMKARFEIDISELCVPRTGLFPETSNTLRKVHEALWAIATLTKLRELGVTANTLEKRRGQT